MKLKLAEAQQPKKAPRLAFLETTPTFADAFALPKTKCSYCCLKKEASEVLIFGEIKNLCRSCQDRHKEFILPRDLEEK